MEAPRSPLVDVDWLAAHAEGDLVRIVDARWYLGDPARGAAAYRAGHLPGAVFVDVDADLAAAPARGPGRHPIPDTHAFAATLARIGVARGTIVVAYDDAGGAIAARLWWLLRYFGHDGGRVLDGGIGAWTARGLPLSTDAVAPSPTAPLDLSPCTEMVIDKAAIDRLRSGDAAILDARGRERYEGKSEPIDARAGHIPGARSAPFVENLVAPGGRFLAREALEAKYRAIGAVDAPKVVCYCGSGVTACHDLVALALLGREDALLYEGSWSDWARDSALPATTGPNPK